jgi:hypothetical protein
VLGPCSGRLGFVVVFLEYSDSGCGPRACGSDSLFCEQDVVEVGLMSVHFSRSLHLLFAIMFDIMGSCTELYCWGEVTKRSPTTAFQDNLECSLAFDLY